MITLMPDEVKESHHFVRKWLNETPDTKPPYQDIAIISTYLGVLEEQSDITKIFCSGDIR